MKKFDILKMHETFTDESNSVIVLEDLLKNIESLSNEEKSEILRQVYLCSEEQNKVYMKEKKTSEAFYKNREKISTEKRKVVSVKKVTKDQSKYINDSINSHNEIIEKLKDMSLKDFKEYVLELCDKTEINYYLLGLIKERSGPEGYQRMANEAYLLNEKDLINDAQHCFSELNEKIEILKSIEKNEKVDVEDSEKCRIIFLETSSLRSCFLEDIDGLEEFFGSFQKIFLSLEDGNPYKMKYFNNNNKLNGLIETRDPYGQTRIFFDKLDDKTYIILNALVKKEDKSMGYKNQIETRYSYYLQRKSSILSSLNDSEYLLRQEQHLIDAKEKLGLEQDPMILVKNRGGV